ncbi:hypothetical protein HK102_001441 [Quaeritorhiza haematococci]|nr:hypothetical protein HK102_001441 [Quaeritorhiza haematococci]
MFTGPFSIRRGISNSSSPGAYVNKACLGGEFLTGDHFALVEDFSMCCADLIGTFVGGDKFVSVELVRVSLQMAYFPSFADSKIHSIRDTYMLTRNPTRRNTSPNDYENEDRKPAQRLYAVRGIVSAMWMPTFET